MDEKVAEKEGLRIAVQTKCYYGRVGNVAVQQVVSGQNYGKNIMIARRPLW